MCGQNKSQINKTKQKTCSENFSSKKILLADLTTLIKKVASFYISNNKMRTLS